MKKKKEQNIFPSSKEDIQTISEQKKDQNNYFQLLKDGKFNEAQELWNSRVKNSFIVKELQIIF
jgi:hypothetical protein